MKAVITYNGQQYVYPDGPALPCFDVKFYPGAGVAFRLGDAQLSTPASQRVAPFNMDSYHVTITDGADTLFDKDLSLHAWNEAWLYRLRRPAIVRTAADLVAARRIFLMGPNGNPEPKYTPGVVTFTGPLEHDTIKESMPTTGERGDIGLVTEVTAKFIRYGDPIDMIDWAEASFSIPYHIRDGGKSLDLLKYPSANGAFKPGSQGQPWLPPAPKVTVDPWKPQQAHMPSLCYEAHMATLDPLYLEELGDRATFMFVVDAAASDAYGKAVFHGERRGIAWALRDLFAVHTATMDAEERGDLPPSCHPSSYWKKLLDQNLAYLTSTTTKPVCAMFNITTPAQYNFAPWMQDYFLSALSFGILTGHADWEQLYLFNLGNLIKRFNNKSGLPSACGTIYMHPLTADGKDSSAPLTWRGMFDMLTTASSMTQAQHDALLADPINGYKSSSSPQYMDYTNAVFNMADYLDRTVMAGRIRAAYPDFDICRDTAHRMFLNYGKTDLRHTFVSVPAPAPDPTPQPQPASGVTIMPSSAGIKIGETKQLNVAVTPPDADRSGLSYSAQPEGFVTLKPNAAGLAVTRVGPGDVVIHAALNGHVAEAVASYTAPLAESLELVWAE